jgi:hypothetical protein
MRFGVLFRIIVRHVFAHQTSLNLESASLSYVPGLNMVVLDLARSSCDLSYLPPGMSWVRRIESDGVACESTMSRRLCRASRVCSKEKTLIPAE